MGILDKLTGSAEKIAKQAEKALDQGKSKVEQLQLERQMDAAARRIGYMEYDKYRGGQIDEAAKQDLLEELRKLDAEYRAMGEAAPAEGSSAMAGGGGDVPFGMPVPPTETGAPGQPTSPSQPSAPASEAAPPPEPTAQADQAAPGDSSSKPSEPLFPGEPPGFQKE